MEPCHARRILSCLGATVGEEHHVEITWCTLGDHPGSLPARFIRADGKSNYGGSWNGVAGSVTGLFYGDASQLTAQLVGVATLVGFVFTFSFAAYWVVDKVVGQRVAPEAELMGLDLPEMGAVGYPEFEIKTRQAAAGA